MRQPFEARDIALKNLALHPANVRATAPGAYDEAQVAPLAANIRACGLIQPLLVAPMPGATEGQGAWGVLAGGRRLAALKLLAADKTAKGFSGSMAIPCRVVPEGDLAHVTLSFSENALQLPMDALDRFEAFAAMREKDGQDVATIARSFAITERAVREALRLGNTHPEIRQAHREGRIDLEALKAFEAHPDQGVQLAAFETLAKGATYGRLQAWQVRQHFRDRAFVRAGDALGRFVLEEYRAQGGPMIADLIEEDSILEDATLVDAILRRKLGDLAEERRAAQGLAWSDVLLRPGWDELRAFGRVYPQPRDLCGDEQAEVDQLSAQVAAIEESYGEAASDEDCARIEAETEALAARIDEITLGYGETDRAVGGVIAVWTGSEVKFHDGMVRPEDIPKRDGSAQGAGSDGSGAGAAGQGAMTAHAHWSATLRTDMAHVRTRAVALALAQAPDLARDYAEFTIVQKILGAGHARGFGDSTTLRAEAGAVGPKEPEGSLAAIEDVFSTLREGLALDWSKQGGAGAFAAFRALPAENRGALLAFVVAATLTPKLADALRDPVRGAVEREALPNLREVWTPDEAFLGRLTKPALLDILSSELAMANEAEALSKAKKSEIVTYLSGLFVAPFATLSEDQRTRVAEWCPAPLVTPEPVGEGEEALGCDGIFDDDDDAGEGDPDEDEPADGDASALAAE